MEDDPSAEAFKEAIRNANLPEIDYDQAYQNLQAAVKANTGHTPRQQGPWLVCTSCPNQHTLGWIGMDKKLVGFDETGGPILKPR